MWVTAPAGIGGLRSAIMEFLRLASRVCFFALAPLLLTACPKKMVVADKVAPENPKAADVRGSESVYVIEAKGQPLIVDWQPEARGRPRGGHERGRGRGRLQREGTPAVEGLPHRWRVRLHRREHQGAGGSAAHRRRGQGEPARSRLGHPGEDRWRAGAEPGSGDRHRDGGQEEDDLGDGVEEGSKRAMRRGDALRARRHHRSLCNAQCRQGEGEHGGGDFRRGGQRLGGQVERFRRTRTGSSTLAARRSRIRAARRSSADR